MNSSSGWLAQKPAGIVFNEHADEDGATMFRHACRVEGVASKRLREATEGAISTLISDGCRSTTLLCGAIVPIDTVTVSHRRTEAPDELAGMSILPSVTMRGPHQGHDQDAAPVPNHSSGSGASRG